MAQWMFERSEGHGAARQIIPQWNSGLVAASIAISFLGAFTSTQLMVQAKTSRYMSAILVWITLASLTFGFCSVWCLHFIAMLACELDLAIGLNAPLTILSAVLAVGFTWLALASGILWERLYRSRRRRAAAIKREMRRNSVPNTLMPLTEPWVGVGTLQASKYLKPDNTAEEQELASHTQVDSPLLNSDAHVHLVPNDSSDVQDFQMSHDPLISKSVDPSAVPLLQRSTSFAGTEVSGTNSEGTDPDDAFTNSDYDSSRRSSGCTTTSDSSFGLGRLASIKTMRQSAFSGRNPFVATALALWVGLTLDNVAKGFVWSLAISGMHYSGILALQIPNGSCTLDFSLVVLSAIISWIVCVVGCILMASMETRLAQQLLFSVIATTGVAAMHFTGMHAAHFWSTDPPSDDRGYPSGLAVAIVSIAIITCLAANGLLAHSATVARNKLAEVVHTRKKLWAAIAQKENAEAAMLARSEFIASASHEIRSPIHQLQGYSDLLARSNLDEESRLLLHAIQDAIRSLSLITTTVLDWSRLEKGEAVCRPTALDIRRICESVLNIIPSQDEDSQVELLIAVAPNVPSSLFIDETYLQRIIMNLLSNSLKFTSSGYVMLQVRIVNLEMIVTVRDTGSGIPESFLPQLFEPFKQAQARGPQRGTGLGLSIVRQLLQKMQGKIETESKDSAVHPTSSGTTFTATFPVQPAAETSPGATALSGKLALFCNSDSRSLEGIRTMWSIFGVEAVGASSVCDLGLGFKYIWTSMEYLRDRPALLSDLRLHDSYLVLIPYDEDKKLRKLLGSSLPSHFLPVLRPLMFHKIVQAITDHGKKPTRPDPLSRTVRFSSVVDVLDGIASDPPTEKTKSSKDSASASADPPELPSSLVMLVEDNKINQRLGIKMLKTLGYRAIVAGDGQEAIDLLLQHKDEIAAILMDQSMPRKDGLTATREIREMESDGTLPQRNGRGRPIIAVTAVVGAHAEAMCKSAGTDAFLPKPLSLAKLRDTLELYLGQDEDDTVGGDDNVNG